VHGTTILGLVLALASTILISLSYLREHGAVAGLPPLSLRRPLHSAKLLLANRSWLVGFGMESGGFVLYVVALALAPLALVQSVAAGGVGILAVASAHFAHRRLTRREATGAACAVTGLGLLALSLSGGDARDAPGELGPIVLWLAATAGVAVLVFTSGRKFLGRGVADGIAGGLFFAAGDICTKVTTEGGGRLMFVVPLILGYLLGTSLLQIGYQSGAALTVAGLATLFTNAIPIAAGTVVLREDVPTGTLGAIRIAAFAAVTVGAILLAKPEPPRQPPPRADVAKLSSTAVRQRALRRDIAPEDTGASGFPGSRGTRATERSARSGSDSCIGKKAGSSGPMVS
jgi:hypothetical protein